MTLPLALAMGSVNGYSQQAVCLMVQEIPRNLDGVIDGMCSEFRIRQEY